MQTRLRACVLLFSGVTAMSAWAAAPEPAPSNSIGMAFVLIPAGRFAMGAADDDREAKAQEKPQHQVTITRQFYIGKFEVTQAQWLAVMGCSPYCRSTNKVAVRTK